MLIQNFFESFIPTQISLGENYIDAHSYPPLPLIQGAVLWSVGYALFFFFSASRNSPIQTQSIEMIVNHLLSQHLCAVND